MSGAQQKVEFVMLGVDIGQILTLIERRLVRATGQDGGVQDPGWDFSLRSFPYTFVPQYAIQRAAKQPGFNVLAFTRQMFVSYCLSLAAITVVVFILAGTVQPEDPQSALAAGMVGAFGIAGLIAGRLLHRQLDCSSDASLAASYQTRFFLRVAFAQSAALGGFALSIALGPWWVYLIGLGFAAIGMFKVAPTRPRLEVEQAELTANGCHRSLSRALSDNAVAASR